MVFPPFTVVLSPKEGMLSKFKTWFKRAWEEVKQIMTTKEGWFAWFLANVVVNLPWIGYLIGYLFTFDSEYLKVAGIIYALMWAPPPIETFVVAFLTPVFYKIILKLKGKQNENH
jgi:hypothetical protein